MARGGGNVRNRARKITRTKMTSCNPTYTAFVNTEASPATAVTLNILEPPPPGTDADQPSQWPGLVLQLIVPTCSCSHRSRIM